MLPKNAKRVKGGGVGIAISKSLKFCRREDLENCLEMLELCIIELLGRKKKVLIAAVYRAPNSNDREFLNNLRKLIDLLNKEQNCEIIIGLDHNYDLLKSHTHRATQDLIDLLLNSDLWPVITKPTRITKTSATLIDNILVSPNIYGSYQCGIMLEDLSDHLPCVLVAKNLKLERKEPVVITSRKLTPSTISKIKAELSSLNLMPHLLEKGINDGFEYLHEKVISTVDKIAPYESFTLSKYKFRRDPWLPCSLLKSIKKQHQLYKLTLKRGCSQKQVDHYKAYRNTLTKLKWNCKNLYYLNKCCEFKSNTKALWNIINKVARDNKDKSCVISYIKDGDISYNKLKQIAEVLNNHFSGIGLKYAKAIKDSKKSINSYLSALHQNTKASFWTPVTPGELRKIINNLPNKRSSGHDNLDNCLLKEISPCFLDELVYLFNKSLSEGIFPVGMKLAEVIPLYKGNERFLSNNYRPISLLLTLSKLLEKIVYKRTYDFLNSSGQIFDSQYGFRAKHSCEHAIQELVSSILKGFENKCSTLSVFLDLSKAFDTIPHDVLFNKLERYGIRGVCLDWFKSYLTGRQMRVKCVSESGTTVYSDCLPVRIGTPQGSILGPLIFLIFNNDLHLHLSYSNCILFADDTTIYATHKNLRHLVWCICEDLRTLRDWFKANKLTLNLSKSVCILFNDKNVSKSSYLTEIGIPISDRTKFLGVQIDDKLDWHSQFNHVQLKIKRNLNMLKRGCRLLTTGAKKILYYGHIYSHLSYCISTWGPMLEQNQIKKLQKLQNKCINLIDQRKTSLKEKFCTLRILSVQEIIKFELAKIGFKLLTKQLPNKIIQTISMDQKLNPLQKTHSYATRHKGLLNLSCVFNKKYQSSFLCKALKEIQPLLSITNESNDIAQFTRLYKNKLFTN